MKTGSILTECLVILAVAAVLGTAVHLTRSDKLRIKFFEQYENPLDPRPKTPASEDLASSEGKKMIEKARKAAKDQAQPTPVPVEIGKEVTKTIQTATGPSGPQKVSTEAHKPAKVVQKSGVPEIGVEEAFEQFKNDAVFLDARRTRFYEQGHIPRARAMSVWEADLDKRISELLNEVPLDMTMVIYCTGGDCEDSH